MKYLSITLVVVGCSSSPTGFKQDFHVPCLLPDGGAATATQNLNEVCPSDGDILVPQRCTVALPDPNAVCCVWFSWTGCGAAGPSSCTIDTPPFCPDG